LAQLLIKVSGYSFTTTTGVPLVVAVKG